MRFNVRYVRRGAGLIVAALACAGVLLGTGTGASGHKPVGVVADTVPTPPPAAHPTPEDDRWN